MNDDYIAGFFDGEGSAMMITIKRKIKRGIVYQFRPTIKIAQNTTPVLEMMIKHLGYGTIQKAGNGTYSIIIKNIKDVTDFCDRMVNITFLKTKQLVLLSKFCFLMTKHGNCIYSKKKIERFINIRDRIHILNNKTRSNPPLKYSKEKIMKEHAFINVRIWKQRRIRNSKIALEKINNRNNIKKYL